MADDFEGQAIAVSASPEQVEPETIGIEIVYALPDKQTLLNADVPLGTTLEQGIALSGINDIHPELDISSMQVGIFSKIAPRDQVLREKDRIELYRPLFADPKEIRKQRAAAGKAMKNQKKKAVAKQ